MHLLINLLSKEGFQRLENFCNQTGIKMKYNVDAKDYDLYDVRMSSIEKQLIFKTTNVFEGEESIILTDLSSHYELSIDSSEFLKVVII